MQLRLGRAFWHELRLQLRTIMWPCAGLGAIAVVLLTANINGGSSERTHHVEPEIAGITGHSFVMSTGVGKTIIGPSISEHINGLLPPVFP